MLAQYHRKDVIRAAFQMRVDRRICGEGFTRPQTRLTIEQTLRDDPFVGGHSQTRRVRKSTGEHRPPVARFAEPTRDHVIILIDQGDHRTRESQVVSHRF